MPTNTAPRITEQQWLEAVEAFELGHRNGSQIARDLGVSAATVSREFKRRGARKACRVAEIVVELEASLDAKARRRARERSAQEAAALERLALLDALIGDMVKSLIVAERAGDLAAARPKVNEIGRALGVKGLR